MAEYITLLTESQIISRLGLHEGTLPGIGRAEVRTALQYFNCLPLYIRDNDVYSPTHLVKLANAAAINAFSGSPMPSLEDAIALVFQGARLMPQHIEELINPSDGSTPDRLEWAIGLGLRLKYNLGIELPKEEPGKVSEAEQQQLIKDIVIPYLESPSSTDWRIALAAAMIAATIPLGKYKIV